MPAQQQPPPGLPTTHPPPTRSFWQLFNSTEADPPSKDDGSSSHVDVTDYLHSERMPEELIDVVVIGCGISGGVAAHELPSDLRSPPSVVLLEARSACSGATVRNGGHCRPDAFAGYPHYLNMVGREKARQVLLNETQTMEHMASLVKEHNIDCDWDESGTCAAYMTVETRDAGKSAYEMYRKDWGDGAVEKVKWHEGEDAARITRLPGCLSAALFPAASLWPLKFVHALLRISIQRGLRLYTHTPVYALNRESEGTETIWRVQTSRGIVRARHVLVATNGYSTSLLPGLKDWILPHRSQCSSHRVPTSFTLQAAEHDEPSTPPTSAGPLKLTYSIVRSPVDYDYLVQNSSTGQFVIGGGNPNAPIEEQMGFENMDDSVLLEGLTRHLTETLDVGFEGFKEEREREVREGKRPQPGVTSMWSGIQGYTRDSLPIVGQVPWHLASDGEYDGAEDWRSKSGLYACLGFQGHGMARASTCARGTARLILHSLDLQGGHGIGPALSSSFAIDDEVAWENLTRLPRAFRLTRARLERRDVDARRDL